MCQYNTKQEVRTVKNKPLVAYKILKYNGDTYTTPFMNRVVSLNTKYVAKGMNNRIFRLLKLIECAKVIRVENKNNITFTSKSITGLHGFTSLRYAKLDLDNASYSYPNGIIVQMIIPVGAQYIKGHFDADEVQNSIVCTEATYKLRTRKKKKK